MFKWRDGTFATSNAWFGRVSKQYRNGFRQGDIILKINGDSIGTFADFQNYHFVKGYKYIFTLRSLRGFNKEVVVEHWGEK